MRSLPYPPFKRALDLSISIPALILSAPMQLAIAAAIRITMGKPVLFIQERPGLASAPFRLRKFRTMGQTHAAGEQHSRSRITPLGRILRETSLDELPSLWNVVAGDMSLVGPRPLLMEYLPRYSAEQARRHDVRPGLTGLAQVEVRNGANWEDRLALDIEYVEGMSFRLDMHILMRTVAAVASRRNVNADDGLTMPEFSGQDGRHGT